MTNEAILMRACRNVLPAEWPITFGFAGVSEVARVALTHIYRFPTGTVIGAIRKEYSRLIGANQ